MYPSGQSQIVLGNQQYSSVPQGSLMTPRTNSGNLWGSNVRRIMGIIQVICGVVEFIFGIVVICIGDYYYYYFSADYVGWGLWNGMFAILTGFMGVCSRKKKCMVITYMVTSIIAAVLCAACTTYAVAGIARARIYSRGRLAVYVIMAITFVIQMVVSIIGASFTCGAVCSASNQTQQVVLYYAPQPQPQQLASGPPMTLMAAPQCNPSENMPTFQNFAPNSCETDGDSKI